MDSHVNYDKPLAIIESYCGQSFGERQVNERIPLTSNIGRLTHARFIRLDSVKVRAKAWAYSDIFGATEWLDISPHDVIVTNGKEIVVPGGVLDVHFTEADVTYTVGYSEVPEAVRKACEILSLQIDNGKTAYLLSAYITPEIAELLEPYVIYNGRGDAY
jgi:hypothetical protein